MYYEPLFNKKGYEFEGEWRDDKMYKGTLRIESVSLEGCFENGTCQGILKKGYKSEKIKGTFSYDLKKCTILPEEKETYQMFYETGQVYQGQINAFFTAHGHGTMRYPNECVFEGSFEHGKREGRGCITYVNKDKFQGTWSQNVRVDGTFVKNY